MPTTVTLFLKGSLVLFAKKNQPIGKVASLRNPPPRHVLKISYRVKPPSGGFGNPIPVEDIKDDLSIQVTNPAQPNITLRKENAPIVRRAAPEHQDSFEWFVDMENEELYGPTIGSIGAIKAKFKQILTFNSGELFAGAPLSYNKLHVQRGSEAEYEEFGFVAGRLGVLFSGDKIVFKKGPLTSDIVFDSSTLDPGTEFRIEVENDALPTSSIVADANHYYKAVGVGIPPDEKILFASIVQRNRIAIELEHQVQELLQDARERGDQALVDALQRLLPLSPPAGPEAACFPAFMGRTELS